MGWTYSYHTSSSNWKMFIIMMTITRIYPGISPPHSDLHDDNNWQSFAVMRMDLIPTQCIPKVYADPEPSLGPIWDPLDERIYAHPRETCQWLVIQWPVWQAWGPTYIGIISSIAIQNLYIVNYLKYVEVVLMSFTQIFDNQQRKWRQRKTEPVEMRRQRTRKFFQLLLVLTSFALRHDKMVYH